MTCYSCGGNPNTWCQQCLPADDTWIAPVDKLPDVFMGDRDHLYMTPDGNFWALSPDRTKWMKVNGQGSNYKAGTGIRLDGDTIVNTQPNRDQSLSVNDHNLTISNGNTVNLPNDKQNLSISGRTLTISNGNSVALPEDKQSLSINGRTISITGGNSITLPEDKDTIYNDTELKRRIQAVESRTDNFVTGVAVSRSGNKVKLTYTFVNGAPKEVEFEDKDTITLAYDDSALKARVNTLENKPQRVITRNINRDLEDTFSHVGLVSLKDVIEIPTASLIDGDIKVGDFINVEISDKSNDNEPAIRVRTLYKVDRLDGGLAIVSKVPNSQKIIGIGAQELKKEGNKLILTGGGEVELPTPSATYDDTDIKKRVTALENKPDNDTKYSVTGDGLSMQNNTIKFTGKSSLREATSFIKSKYVVDGTIPLKKEYRTEKGSRHGSLKYAIDYDGTNLASYPINFFGFFLDIDIDIRIESKLTKSGNILTNTYNGKNIQASNVSFLTHNSGSGSINLMFYEDYQVSLHLNWDANIVSKDNYNSFQLKPVIELKTINNEESKTFSHKITQEELDSSEKGRIEVKEGDNVLAYVNFTITNPRMLWNFYKPSLLLGRSSDDKLYYYD